MVILDAKYALKLVLFQSIHNKTFQFLPNGHMEMLHIVVMIKIQNSEHYERRFGSTRIRLHKLELQRYLLEQKVRQYC